MYVAQGKGFFADEGLELEQIATGGGGPQIAALLARQVDFTVAGGTYQLTAMQQGKPTLGVLNLGLKNLLQFIMHRDVARERGITEASPWDQKLKALRGLTMGATRPGALSWQVAEYVIAQAGMTPQKEVKLIGVGAGPSALAALEQRKVDVVMEGIPVPQAAVERGYGMIFIDYCALRKIGVLHQGTHSPRGGFGRGGGPPLPVGPAGRAPRLRSSCKRGSLPRERSVAGGMFTQLPRRGVYTSMAC